MEAGERRMHASQKRINEINKGVRIILILQKCK